MSYYEINTLEEYFKHYKKSTASQENFGIKLLPKTLLVSSVDKVVDFNMAEAEIKWFTEAKVNITKTVLTSC
jgi:acetyl-CoA synthetase